MVETNIYSILSTTTAVTAITGTRIYPTELPTDATLPAIVYTVISSVSMPTFETAGMDRVRLEIDCWGADALTAINLRSVVRQNIDGYFTASPSITIYHLSDSTMFREKEYQYTARAEYYVLTTQP
jgi:hypothetical protein